MDSYELEDLEVGPEEVEPLLGVETDDIEIVDVREEWELVRGVLPGAVHVPLSRFADYVSSFSPVRRYVIYCEHGVRSLHVAEWLQTNLRVRAKSMRGGFAEWQGPVVEPGGGAR